MVVWALAEQILELSPPRWTLPPGLLVLLSRDCKRTDWPGLGRRWPYDDNGEGLMTLPQKTNPIHCHYIWCRYWGKVKAQLKHDFRMTHNFLKHALGEAIHTLMAVAAFSKTTLINALF